MPRCTRCKKEAGSRGLSKNGFCWPCIRDRQLEFKAQFASKRGPLYEKWKAGVLAHADRLRSNPSAGGVHAMISQLKEQLEDVKRSLRELDQGK